MINKVFSFVLLLGISFSAWANFPVDEVEAWLAKMHHSAHMINYEGTFVYGQNNELSSMQIIHRVDNKSQYERLISLDGSGREVIRTGETVICYLPDLNSVVVEKSRPDAEFPPKFPVKIAHLLKYYDFYLNGEGRVAGQRAKKLIIIPKDNYRYGHELWLDSKTGLLLKDHLIGDNGKMVEQFMFIQIKYPNVIENKRLLYTKNTNAFTWQKANEADSNTKINKSMKWKVAKTPPGFVPGLKKHQNVSVSTLPVEHFLFSDGLSSISVFVEKQMENSKNLVGGSTMGAVNAYGRAMGKYHVTVVGEVPHATVKMVGDSVVQLVQ